MPALRPSQVLIWHGVGRILRMSRGSSGRLALPGDLAPQKMLLTVTGAAGLLLVFYNANPSISHVY